MCNILLIGDSLTELNCNKYPGWGYFMKMWYDGKATIHNEGFSGYTSEMIRNIFPTIIPINTKIIMCTILLGTNDCHLYDKHVEPDDYKDNILFMIDYIHALNNNTVILLITPPIASAAYGLSILYYVKSIKEICAERNFVIEIELYSQENAVTRDDLYDGLHVNDTGNKKIFKNIQKQIIQMCPYLCPENL